MGPGENSISGTPAKEGQILKIFKTDFSSFEIRE